MNKRLTIISYGRTRDDYFEDIAFSANANGHYCFVRCQGGGQLYDCILNHGRDANLLDLVAHGSSSHFEMGDDKSFIRSGWDPPALLGTLKDLLAPNAVVRLLGCYTGVDSTGLDLLHRVSDTMELEVLGTRLMLATEHYTSQGLNPDVPATWFVSSRSKTAQPPLILPLKDTSESFINPQLAEALPKGYTPVGRGQPIARGDFSFYFAGIKVTFACECRLILIEDKPRLPPLVLCWSGATPVPMFSKLLQPFGIQ